MFLSSDHTFLRVEEVTFKPCQQQGLLYKITLDAIELFDPPLSHYFVPEFHCMVINRVILKRTTEFDPCLC
jgi:hypothetical protein